jgi:N-acyl-D-amino-acid deacylase
MRSRARARRLAPLLLRAISLASLFVLAPGAGQAQEWDILIAGGTIVDGTGADPFAADVAIDDGMIVRVSRTPLPRSNAGRIIDARGLSVAPGFIDLHAHLDPLTEMPAAESHVRQGVTTALGNPDGGGPLPLGEYLDTLRRCVSA